MDGLSELTWYAKQLLDYCETGKFIKEGTNSDGSMTIVNPGGLFMQVHEEIMRVAKKV